MDFFLLSGEDKLNMVQNPSKYFNILEIVSNEVIAAQGLIYSVMSIRLIKAYQKKIKEYESTVDKSIIKVLYIGIYLILFSWIIGIIGIHFQFFNIDTGINFFMYTYLVLVIVIYFISYSVVKSPEIFKLEIDTLRDNPLKIKSLILRPKASTEMKDESQESDKVTEQPLPDPQLVSLNERLVQFMENEKPYLNPELNLQDLAEPLNISRNQLSNLINKVHKKNFYEYVNHYRVEKVKQLMKDPSNKPLTLMTLAYEAGFNSKASFNRIFKQMTGMTPSQFFKAQHSN